MVVNVRHSCLRYGRKAGRQDAETDAPLFDMDSEFGFRGRYLAFKDRVLNPYQITAHQFQHLANPLFAHIVNSYNVHVFLMDNG